jgi:5-methylcytosine-specific restriction protein B
MKVLFNKKEYKKNGNVAGENGNGLGKLCFDIFKFYLEQNPKKTYKELQDKFNTPTIHKQLSGSNSKRKVIFNKEDSEKWYKDPENNDSKKEERYFGIGNYGNPLSYNNEELYFTTQWGNSDGNIDNMIKFAEQEGYDIKVMDNEEEKSISIKIKNIILYGAPGVGKTHNYKKLIALIEGGDFSEKDIFDFVINNKDDEIEEGSIERLYQQIKDEKRVEFVTFHQSYSYEDFIEGFRPNESGNIELEDGIFKVFIERCLESSLNIDQNIDIQDISEKPTIWKISLGEAGIIKDECYKTNKIRLGWDKFGDLDSLDKIGQRELKDFYNLEIGDIVLAFKNQWEIDGIGVVTGSYKFNHEYEEYKHERAVKWLTKEKIINVKEYNNNVRMTLSSLYRLSRISKLDVLNMLQNLNGNSIKKNKKQNYYIVIDEINRGNISKIFGELITLIEEDKRDIYEITLPYSKKPFKVPSNLYIIATMNSTDKSIATIDIALRRRFTFLKMKPKLELVENTEAKEFMSVLNQYISKKLGEDYMLGHSYFMGDIDLDFVKEYKIKPLLEEYFYADEKSPDEIIEAAFKEVKKETKVEENND